MGAASVLNILSGLIKMKAAAMLLGPAGVGMIGLYQNLMQTGAQIGSMGLGTVGVQQVAAAQAEGGGQAVGAVRRALFWSTLGLAAIAALALLAASGPIAAHLFAAPERQGDVAWLALGVALTVGAASQTAVLTGLRRIRDMALIQVSAGLLGTGLGILALWLWGSSGIPAVVIAAPVVTYALGHLFVARLGRPVGPRLPLGELVDKWRDFVVLGAAFMLSGLVATLGQLAVRTLVQRELGPEALGYFQASWSIGMTYLGFVLGAMTADYFPRLSAAIADRATATRLVNEQVEVALILCGPVLIAMLAMASPVVRLMYSSEFGPTVDILRWQLLGDILKVMSWPLGYVMLASGAGRLFVLSEAIGVGAFVAVVALALPGLGIVATGIGFLALYVVYLPVVWLIARHRIGFRWSPAVLRQAALLITSAAVTSLLVRLDPFWGGLAGLALALSLAVTGAVGLATRTEATGKVGRLLNKMRGIRGRIRHSK